MTDPVYANPFLSGTNVTPGRIDEGVDYSGTGILGAIARGVITEIVPGGQAGWEGGDFIEYRITEPGPLHGQYVYYAEGVQPVPGLKVGDIVNPAQPIAKITGVDVASGNHTGIEIGFGSGVGTSAYAADHGGYTEGDSTVAGLEFSDLLKRLGAPAGVPLAKTSPGSGPDPNIGSQPFTQTSLRGQAQQKLQGGLIQSTVGAINKGEAVIGSIADFLSNPVHALLTMALVGVGALLMYSGAGKLLGFDQPVRSTAGKLKGLSLAAAAR